jgi:N-ethylmaleimide reductase
MVTAFDPIVVGGRELANRLVMAPMSRSRAYGPDAAPGQATAIYYAQRASAGLIVTEGIQPSPTGRGYPATPGLYSDVQIQAWRRVTDAVHSADGTIFAQLMHAGRIAHPSVLPAALFPLGPSAVRADTQVFTQAGPQPCVEPRAMTEQDIRETVEDFARAAENAVAAGFDGVEIHGANGFLIHQFLADNTNRRSDAWGGAAENKIRFAVQVATAVSEAVGADRVGFHISPGNPYNDVTESRADEVYPVLVTELAALGLAYLNDSESSAVALTSRLRALWPGVFILNPHTSPGPTGPAQLTLVDDGTTDMLSYGVLFLANPDLPARLARGGPFNPPDPATFYGGGAEGYIDYPALADSTRP